MSASRRRIFLHARLEVPPDRRQRSTAQRHPERGRAAATARAIGAPGHKMPEVGDGELFRLLKELLRQTWRPPEIPRQTVHPAEYRRTDRLKRRPRGPIPCGGRPLEGPTGSPGEPAGAVVRRDR
jgi:hypothetical protein